MENNKKILILANGLPVYSGGHSDMLLDQIIDYGLNNVCFFSTKYIPITKQINIIDNIVVKVSPLRIFNRNGLLGKILNKVPLIEELLYIFFIKKRKVEILKFALNNNVKLVYAILREDTLPLINFLIKRLNLPLVAFVPDTVEAEIKDKKIIYLIKKCNYYKAVRRSKIIAAAGESMADYFENKFNKECVIFRPGIDRRIIPEILEKSSKSNEVTIGFAGSLYAKFEYNKLISSILIFNKIHQDVKIKILMISNYEPEFIDNLKIEYHRWYPQDQLLKILTKVDIGYLPYIFNKKYKHQMKYAFPGKIASYLALQIPVFFHGPEYSSVNYFLKKYPCGISCNSMKEEDIINKLEKLIYDKVFYNDCRKLCKEAYVNELTKELMIRNFRYFIEKGFE